MICHKKETFNFIQLTLHYIDRVSLKVVYEEFSEIDDGGVVVPYWWSPAEAHPLGQIPRQWSECQT